MNAVGFMKRLFGMLPLVVVLASPVVAQEGEAGRPRVTISASSGYMMGGPASGYEAMLEAAGFGDVLRGGCTLGSCNFETDYPVSNSDPGPGSNLRVAYSQWSLLEFAFSMGTANPSESEGYSAVIVPDFGSFSEIESKLRMFAPTAGVRWRFLGAGAGPAYYKLTTTVTDEDMPFDESTEAKWGALIEGRGVPDPLDPRRPQPRVLRVRPRTGLLTKPPPGDTSCRYCRPGGRLRSIRL